MKPLTVPARVRVEVGGSALPPAVARSLGRVCVRQVLSLPAQCELTLVDPPTNESSFGRAFAPGSTLKVTVDGHSTALFDGEVTAVEHHYDSARGREVRVRGYDRLHRLRKRQPVKAHVQASLADLARDLVGGDGLSVEAHDDPGLVWERLFQHDQSDFELLADAAQRCGLHFTVQEGALHLLSLAGAGLAIPLTLGEELFEARLEANGDPGCRSVEARAWDPATAEPRQGRAASPRTGRRVLATVPPDAFSSPGERVLAGEVTRDDKQADALAQAELDRRAAREVTLWGIAEGDPRLRPGAKVEIVGVDPAFAGEYTLTSVTHTIDPDRGHLSELSTVPPAAERRPKGTVIALATISRIDDPENLGRVQATLPAYNNAETGWMGVVTAGAGKGKGLISLPDVGDQVVVLCAREDLAQGIVLGGLYGVTGAPDTGIDGGAVKRYSFLTPGGQKIQLDDARNAVRVETSGGSYIDLSPKSAHIHAATDLLIEAPGKRVAIKGKAIDFSRA